MSTFGDLERAFGELYPYRWYFAAGLILVMAALTFYAYRRGWHSFVWRNRISAGIIATPALAITLWLGWSLGSPLFTNTTVDEAFPFAATATVPAEMDIEDVETIMAGMAKFESSVDEEMPIAITNHIGSAQPSPVASETPGSPAGESAEASSPAGPIILKQGQFQDIDGFHKGTGTATIYQAADGSRLLRLENFKVTNGPDLHVVLSPYEGPQESDGRLKTEGYVDLGSLKGNIGNQNYTVPDAVDIGIQNSVTIWCKPFNVIFSVAVLQ